MKEIILDKKMIQKEIKRIEIRVEMLMQKEPIFGFISEKWIRCGKKNCKCRKGREYYHGPYYYLRTEPEYKYNNYIGKKIPNNIENRIKVGNTVSKLERKKKELKKIKNIL